MFVKVSSQTYLINVKMNDEGATVSAFYSYYTSDSNESFMNAVLGGSSTRGDFFPFYYVVNTMSDDYAMYSQIASTRTTDCMDDSWDIQSKYYNK